MEFIKNLARPLLLDFAGALKKTLKSGTALTKSSKGAALPCPQEKQEKQRVSCTALTEKQRVAALRSKNSCRDTSLRVLESYDPKR